MALFVPWSFDVTNNCAPDEPFTITAETPACALLIASRMPARVLLLLSMVIDFAAFGVRQNVGPL